MQNGELQLSYHQPNGVDWVIYRWPAGTRGRFIYRAPNGSAADRWPPSASTLQPPSDGAYRGRWPWDNVQRARFAGMPICQDAPIRASTIAISDEPSHAPMPSQPFRQRIVRRPPVRHRRPQRASHSSPCLAC